MADTDKLVLKHLDLIKEYAEGKFVEKETGKVLSTNDYDNTEKQKVADAYADKHTHEDIDPDYPEILPIVNMIDDTVPASPTATGTKGQMVSDENYIYICTATNTWCRISKEAWA